MIDAITAQLARLQAMELRVDAVEESRIRVRLGEQSCVLEAEGFLAMLKSLPDGVGSEAVKDAIQNSALHGEHWAGV